METRFSDHNKKLFDGFAGEYAGHAYWRGDEENAVERYFKDHTAPLLIGGVGGGRTIPYLQKKGFTITAIDIAPKMVAHCKERYSIDVHTMDIQRMTFENESFTYVFLPFNTIICVDDVRRTLQEIHRVLKPGGVLIFTATNHYNIRGFMQGDFIKPRRRSIRLMRKKAGDALGYHFTFGDARWIRNIFSKVEVSSRIAMQRIEKPNWKDRILQLLPFFDKSLYFVCIK